MNATIRNPFMMASLMAASMVGLLFCMKNNKKVANSCCCCCPRERPSPGFNPKSKMQMGGMIALMLATIGCGVATYKQKQADEAATNTDISNTNLACSITGIFLSLCGGIAALAGLQGMLPSGMSKRKGPIMSIGFVTALAGMAFCVMSRPQNRAAVKDKYTASRAKMAGGVVASKEKMGASAGKMNPGSSKSGAF